MQPAVIRGALAFGGIYHVTHEMLEHAVLETVREFYCLGQGSDGSMTDEEHGEYRRRVQALEPKNKFGTDVGIDGLVPHGLRHTAASLAISAGASVKVVQRRLGHATAAMTLDRYAHRLNDDLSGVADALGKAIDGAAVSLRYSERSDEAESA